jgi:hypothetical protein
VLGDAEGTEEVFVDEGDEEDGAFEEEDEILVEDDTLVDDEIFELIDGVTPVQVPKAL